MNPFIHPKQLFHHYHLEPKQSLGQNFLFEDSILQKIVNSADIQPTDPVLEIGPGVGGLTRWLAKSAESLIAVELDQRLLPILEQQMAGQSHVTLIHGDILEQDTAQLFSKPYKVVANVPYYITGAILRHLLEGIHKPTCIVLTVQKEVADRISAEPDEMNLLAASVQFYGRAKTVMTIPAGAFWPRPTVGSAVVRIDLHTEPRLVAEDRYFRVVKAGFAQKRKQLKNNLRMLSFDDEQIEKGLAQAGIDGRRRAETLTILEWQHLTQALDHQSRPMLL